MECMNEACKVEWVRCIRECKCALYESVKITTMSTYKYTKPDFNAEKNESINQLPAVREHTLCSAFMQKRMLSL